ncbi:MAG: diadenylate cyclase CdaA [Oscillospiraceae bacterium]|nr:diadenylate cyclase CdaA [Oscillospiraceae bacterium]
MEILSNLFANAGRYLLLIRITDILDIAILAYLIYHLLRLVRNTKATSLLKGVAVFLVVLWLSGVLHLHGINYILKHMVEVGVLALIILFQPEIRRILEQVGSRKYGISSLFVKEQIVGGMENVISQTVLACSEMSKARTGALIVFEREIKLSDLVRSGTVLNANLSSELLKNVFYNKAPLHDGAVIVRDGRILGAGCVLPLSRNVNLSRELGTRHRAGIGMSENSDAVVVIVSEETGSVSVAVGGMLKRHLQPETLEYLLRNELLPQEKDATEKNKFDLLALLKLKKNGADDENEDE